MQNPSGVEIPLARRRRPPGPCPHTQVSDDCCLEGGFGAQDLTTGSPAGLARWVLPVLCHDEPRASVMMRRVGLSRASCVFFLARMRPLSGGESLSLCSCFSSVPFLSFISFVPALFSCHSYLYFLIISCLQTKHSSLLISLLLGWHRPTTYILY